MDNKLLVLIINDMVIFPNTEVRIEYDNNYDKRMIDIVNKVGDNLMLIVNPILDDSSPKYRNENGKYIMLNENLSIGLNYSF